jgi:hypothetical protein
MMINGRTVMAALLIEMAIGSGASAPALAADESPVSPGGNAGAPVTNSPAGAGATATARHRVDAVSIAALVAAGEPPLMELREAATALVMAQPERARSLLWRAGAAGWLPEVRVRVDRRFGRDESLDYGRTSLDDAAPVGMNTHQDVRYEVRATWDLSRIVFNPDELGAHMEALRIADVRREVEMMVVRLVFERRRLKTEAATSDSPDITPRLRRELRIQEIEAELDALTGGAFSRPRTTRTSNAASQTP